MAADVVLCTDRRNNKEQMKSECKGEMLKNQAWWPSLTRLKGVLVGTREHPGFLVQQSSWRGGNLFATAFLRERHDLEYSCRPPRPRTHFCIFIINTTASSIILWATLILPLSNLTCCGRRSGQVRALYLICLLALCSRTKWPKKSHSRHTIIRSIKQTCNTLEDLQSFDQQFQTQKQQAIEQVC